MVVEILQQGCKFDFIKKVVRLYWGVFNAWKRGCLERASGSKSYKLYGMKDKPTFSIIISVAYNVA